MFIGRYSDEFKAKAKTLASKSNDSYESTAKKLGISSSTLRNWMNQETPVFLDKNAKPIDNHLSYLELKKHIHKLEVDLVAKNNEIKFLKKIVGYFAQSQIPKFED